MNSKTTKNVAYAIPLCSVPAAIQIARQMQPTGFSVLSNLNLSFLHKATHNRVACPHIPQWAPYQAHQKDAPWSYNAWLSVYPNELPPQFWSLFKVEKEVVHPLIAASLNPKARCPSPKESTRAQKKKQLKTEIPKKKKKRKRFSKKKKKKQKKNRKRNK